MITKMKTLCGTLAAKATCHAGLHAQIASVYAAAWTFDNDPKLLLFYALYLALAGRG